MKRVYKPIPLDLINNKIFFYFFKSNNKTIFYWLIENVSCYIQK